MLSSPFAAESARRYMLPGSHRAPGGGLTGPATSVLAGTSSEQRAFCRDRWPPARHDVPRQPRHEHADPVRLDRTGVVQLDTGRAARRHGMARGRRRPFQYSRDLTQPGSPQPSVRRPPNQLTFCGHSGIPHRASLMWARRLHARRTDRGHRLVSHRAGSTTVTYHAGTLLNVFGATRSRESDPDGAAQ